MTVAVAVDDDADVADTVEVAAAVAAEGVADLGIAGNAAVATGAAAVAGIGVDVDNIADFASIF
jgi:hypothetical protein